MQCHFFVFFHIAYIFFSFAGAMDDSQFYYDAWNDSHCSCPGCDGLTTKLCIDAQFASSECGTEPPVFVCDKCANRVRAEFLLDIVQPIGEVAASCENKPCKGDDRTAKYTCFSESCIKKQRYEKTVTRNLATTWPPLYSSFEAKKIGERRGEGRGCQKGAMINRWGAI